MVPGHVAEGIVLNIARFCGVTETELEQRAERSFSAHFVWLFLNNKIRLCIENVNGREKSGREMKKESVTT